jgi:3-dehydroquinate synthase
VNSAERPAGEPRKVEVSLGKRSYSIEIGTGNLADVASFVHDISRATHVVLVTDEHLEATHAATVAERLDGTNATVDMVVIEPGEESKSIEMAEHLWEKMLELGTDRKSVVVAVGGGVVGDLAGFAAATFARGLDFFQVPTTLLAQVDSSVGGKTGVNLPGAKNMVGAFWQPRGVLVDTAVLATLPAREYRAGLAEAVKYGVILDADFFAYLETRRDGLIDRNDEVLRHVIARSCELKAQVVAADERETSGRRAVLNYGHTFAHAIEAVNGYGEMLHGEAVAVGMACASRLAERLGRVDAEFSRRQNALLAHLGLPLVLPAVSIDRLLEAMQHDKKTEHGRLRFVLPTRLGHVELVGNVSADDARWALESTK